MSCPSDCASSASSFTSTFMRKNKKDAGGKLTKASNIIMIVGTIMVIAMTTYAGYRFYKAITNVDKRLKLLETEKEDVESADVISKSDVIRIARQELKHLLDEPVEVEGPHHQAAQAPVPPPTGVPLMTPLQVFQPALPRPPPEAEGEEAEGGAAEGAQTSSSLSNSAITSLSSSPASLSFPGADAEAEAASATASEEAAEI